MLGTGDFFSKTIVSLSNSLPGTQASMMEKLKEEHPNLYLAIIIMIIIAAVAPAYPIAVLLKILKDRKKK